jgi:hypothetical protein
LIEHQNPLEELAHVAEEQAALHRVGTLAAAGAPELELVSSVTSEIGRLNGGRATSKLH